MMKFLQLNEKERELLLFFNAVLTMNSCEVHR